MTPLDAPAGSRHDPGSPVQVDQMILPFTEHLMWQRTYSNLERVLHGDGAMSEAILHDFPGFDPGSMEREGNPPSYYRIPRDAQDAQVGMYDFSIRTRRHRR